MISCLENALMLNQDQLSQPSKLMRLQVAIGFVKAVKGHVFQSQELSWTVDFGQSS